MSVYEYDLPMPSDYEALLLEIIDISREEHTLTGEFSHSGEDEIEITIGKKTIRKKIVGEVFRSFSSLRLIDHYTRTKKLFGGELELDFNYFIFLPKAFEWFNYHKKNRVMKCFSRHPVGIKDIALIASLILSMFSSLWVVIQIFRFFHPN